MNPERALTRGRARAEALMVDECRIWAENGDETTDPHTGAVVFGRTLIYEGPCKFQMREAWETEPTSAGTKFTAQRYQLHIPVAAGPARVGHLVEPVHATHDPHLVGRWQRVTASFHKSYATAQRMGIQEVTA